MSSRNIINLILLVVVGALVAVLVLKPGKKTPPVIKLTELSSTSVHKIAISRPGAKQVVLEKKDNQWQMLAPYKIKADNFKANSITELAEAKTNAHFPITKGENLKPYGLDTPRVTVVFNDEDKLEFGGIETLRYQRYIRKDDNLYLIFDRYFSNVSNPPAEFADHALLPNQVTIDKLVLPKLSLSRKGDQWQAQPPVKELSNDQVNELLDDWTSAHATDVSDYTPAKGKQEQAQIFIKGQAKPMVFDILHEKNAIALGRPDIGLKYSLTKSTANELLKLPPKIKPTPVVNTKAKKPVSAKH